MLAVPGGAEGDTAEAQDLFTKGLLSTSPQGPSSGYNAHRNTGGISQSRMGIGLDGDGEEGKGAMLKISPPRSSLSPHPGALSPRSDTGKSEAESASVRGRSQLAFTCSTPPLKLLTTPCWSLWVVIGTLSTDDMCVWTHPDNGVDFHLCSAAAMRLRVW